MKRKISNYGDSVRARLLALARSENVQLEYLLLRYALERFLSPVITTKGFTEVVAKPLFLGVHESSLST